MALIVFNQHLHTIRFENGYNNKPTQRIISTFVRRRNVIFIGPMLVATKYRLYVIHITVSIGV